MARASVWIGGNYISLTFLPGRKACDVLADNGIDIPRPCGGRGVCGKCACDIQGEVSPANDAETRLGKRLLCQARLLGDVTIRLNDPRAIEQIETGTNAARAAAAPMPGAIGAAVDIGTTTLALKLFDLRSGACLASAAAMNPQTSVAADVMGRIDSAVHGGGTRLREQVTNALTALAEDALCSCAQNNARIDAFVATGNTTMLTLLTGRDPASLSRAPFEADCLFDTRARLFDADGYLPPCIHAFVGADTVCAALACGMCDGSETALLCDIGTNGEIALWHDRRLYVTSTAAGPAFEGAGISCGVRGIRGAIDAVWALNSGVGVRTIGGGKAVGVCGSGLIDAVAAFLQLGEIDETGAMLGDRLILADGVALLPGDIRAVQLAKAAIAAGIRTIAQTANVALADIDRVYIAGGFGSHLNVSGAIAIGLIPRAFLDRVRAIGNAALDGAARMLLDVRAIDRAREIAGFARHVPLGGNPAFNAQYIEQMLFPSDEPYSE